VPKFIKDLFNKDKELETTKADIDSPNFTGIPTTPTPTDDGYTDQIVNIEYLNQKINIATGFIVETNRIFTTMKKYFRDNKANSMTPLELTNLVTTFYSLLDKSWHGWVDFYEESVSLSNLGTKGGDNADLICEPSSQYVRGQDDYANIPLFFTIDCNFYVDSETLEPIITAIDGITNNFERYNPEVFVGVLHMTGYHYRQVIDSYERFGYSGTYIDGYNMEPFKESIRPSDNSVRPWMIHSKYASSMYGSPTKLTSYSQSKPLFFALFANLQSYARNTGSQYSASVLSDLSYLKLMNMIKYANRTADDNLQGCVDMNINAKCACSETDTNRVLIPSSNSSLEAGMVVLVGTGTNRNATAGYSISGNRGFIISSIETVTINDSTYKAVYFEDDVNITTQSNTTVILPVCWKTGTTDTVMGNDGAIFDSVSGKYPCKLQGIEFNIGLYEVASDTLSKYYLDPSDNKYYVEWFYFDRTANQTNTVNSNAKSYGWRLPQRSTEGMDFISEIQYFDGVYFPTKLNGSSSTSYKDQLTRIGPSQSSLMIAYSLGAIEDGKAKAGLYSFLTNRALNTTFVSRGTRLSPNGNKGVFTPPEVTVTDEGEG